MGWERKTGRWRATWKASISLSSKNSKNKMQNMLVPFIKQLLGARLCAKCPEYFITLNLPKNSLKDRLLFSPLET